MKTDRYIAALDAVTNQAIDKWDLERMRTALVEARAKVENRLFALKQEEFRKNAGGK